MPRIRYIIAILLTIASIISLLDLADIPLIYSGSINNAAFDIPVVKQSVWSSQSSNHQASLRQSTSFKQIVDAIVNSRILVSNLFFSTVIRIQLDRADSLATILTTDQLNVLISAFVTACNISAGGTDFTATSSTANEQYISTIHHHSKTYFIVDVTIHVVVYEGHSIYSNYDTFRAEYTTDNSPWDLGNNAYIATCALSTSCRPATLETIRFSDAVITTDQTNTSNPTISPTPVPTSTSSSSSFQLIFILGIIFIAVIAGPLLVYGLTRYMRKSNIISREDSRAAASSAHSPRRVVRRTHGYTVSGSDVTFERLSVTPGMNIVDLDTLPVEVGPSSITVVSPNDLNDRFRHPREQPVKKQVVAATAFVDSDIPYDQPPIDLNFTVDEEIGYREQNDYGFSDSQLTITETPADDSYDDDEEDEESQGDYDADHRVRTSTRDSRMTNEGFSLATIFPNELSFRSLGIPWSFDAANTAN